MIDTHLRNRLSELLALHGELSSLSQIPTNHQNGKCMILATMKSQQDAARLQRQFGFQPFGYNSLIIGEEWLTANLIE